MASITRDQNGNRRIQFVAPDGKRPAIRLGKVSQRAAEAVKFRIEQLLAAKLTGHGIEADTANWVLKLDPVMAAKLARVGLISKPEHKASTELGPFMTAHIEGRADLKSATKVVRGQVVRDLSEYFGEKCDVRTITPGHADDFKMWLIGRGLASTTIHKRIQVARSLFNAMLRRKLIAENPFEGVKAAAIGIKDRQQFITREEIARVLDKCPDHHWRAIVALVRFGGLRNPSETLSLRWQDIDWAGNRILVQSPKTEHHAGKDCREIPLFPELLPILTEAFELAPDGAEYVIDEKYRKAAMGPSGWMNANLRTTFEKIIRRAGLKPWPRLFHNLRASRETELVEKYPVQVVTAWLGNTPSVAMKHYLMVTDEHFNSAVRDETHAAQKAAQQGAVLAGNTSHGARGPNAEPLAKLGVADNCDLLQRSKMAGTGFEPVTSRL